MKSCFYFSSEDIEHRLSLSWTGPSSWLSTDASAWLSISVSRTYVMFSRDSWFPFGGVLCNLPFYCWFHNVRVHFGILLPKTQLSNRFTALSDWIPIRLRPTYGKPPDKVPRAGDTARSRKDCHKQTTWQGCVLILRDEGVSQRVCPQGIAQGLTKVLTTPYPFFPHGYISVSVSDNLPTGRLDSICRI